MKDIRVVLGDVEFISVIGTASINFGKAHSKDISNSTKSNDATGGTYGDCVRSNKIANQVKLNDIDFMDSPMSKF